MWEPFLLAALPPAIVWLLWRLQTLSVEILRGRLIGLARNPDQRWLYAVVSWFGTFLHEASHALVLLLTGHGIRGFRAGVEEGHVLPARMHRGAGTLFFLVAALAPLFIPPLLVLVGLWLVLGAQPVAWAAAESNLATFPSYLHANLLDGPLRLLRLLAGLDLADWRQALVFALALLGAPGSRPSHVRGSRWHGKDDQGDVAALRQTIRERPLPFVLLLAVVYGSFFALTPFEPRAYWYVWQALWTVAAAGVTLALAGAAFWSLANLDGRVRPLVAWLGPAVFIGIQIAGRMAGDGLTVLARNGISIAAWLCVAIVLGQAVPRRASRRQA